MKAYTLSASALTENGNQLKEVFLQKMVEEEHITEEQKNKMNNYCFVIAEKSFLGKFWDKVYWKKADDEMKIIVVKVIE